MGRSSELQQHPVLLLVIFVLSPHLLVLLLLLTSFSSIKAEPDHPPNCPSTIYFGECGGLLPYSKLPYPFTTIDFPECGYFVLDCIDDHTFLSVRNGGPKTQVEWFGDANKTLVVAPYEKPPPNANTTDLCGLMENFSLLDSPSISFTSLNKKHYVGCPEDYANNISGQQRKKCCSNHYCIYDDDPYGIFDFQRCSVFPDPSTDGFTFQYNLTISCQDCVERGGRCYDHQKSWTSICTEINKTHNPRTIILAAGLSLAGMIILVSVIIVLHIRRRGGVRPLMTRNGRDVEAFLRSNKALSPKRFTYSDIKKITNNFKEKLGQGGYGKVYKGGLLNGCLVAVKLLNQSTNKDGQEFINEVASISRTNHVNIVTLIGFCFEGRRRALIYEFMKNGSLEKFIRGGINTDHQRLPLKTLFKISLGIARGLEYLHRGCNMRMVHFDIKPHNILLDEEFNPKVSDFGLCKLYPDAKKSELSMLEARGTIGYIAPEVISRNIGNVSHKSDVYSYGMMLLDVLGSKKAANIIDENGGSSNFYFPDWIYKQLQAGEELEIDVNEEEKDLQRKMTLVSLWCIQTVPSHRPSMNRVIQLLEGSVDSTEVPPAPAFPSPPRSPPSFSTFSTQH